MDPRFRGGFAAMTTEERVESVNGRDAADLDPAGRDWPEKGEEINLIDLLIVVFERKRMILLASLAAGVLSLCASFLMTKFYRSEAVIMHRESESSASGVIGGMSGAGLLGGVLSRQLGFSEGGDRDRLLVVLRSRGLTERVVSRHDLLGAVFPEDWDSKKKKWKTDEAPTLQDAYEAITEDLLHVSDDVDSGAVRVAFDHPDPREALKITQLYLTELSEFMREEVLSDALQKKRYFSRQIAETTDALLKEKIYELLAREIERETLARAERYYGFVLLDPPVASDPDKEVRPRRALICIASVAGAFFLALLAAFAFEYVRRARDSEDPERLERLRRSLRFGGTGE